MLELLWLLLAVVPRALRSRHDLLLENLFLRQQLQVALRASLILPSQVKEARAGSLGR